MSTAHSRRSTESPSTPRRRRRRPIGRDSNGMLMTPEEFDRRTDFDDRFTYELIHGVLVVSPTSGESERDPNGELEYLFRNYKRNHPSGSVLTKTLSEQYICLPDGRRRADRVVWIGLGRVPKPSTDVPAIAIEIVSNRQRDRVRDYEEKRREYLAAGVQEYWVIDRFNRVMTAFRKEPAEPAEILVKEGDIYTTPLLPGFELPLATVLEVADDWAPAKQSKKKPADPSPAAEQPGQAGDIPPERG